MPVSIRFKGLLFLALGTSTFNRSSFAWKSSFSLDNTFFFINFYFKFVRRSNMPLWIIGWSFWNCNRNDSKSPVSNAQNDKYTSNIGSARIDLILWYFSVFFNSLYWLVFERNLEKYSFKLGSCSERRTQTYFMLSHLMEIRYMAYLANLFVSSLNEA